MRTTALHSRHFGAYFYPRHGVAVKRGDQDRHAPKSLLRVSGATFANLPTLVLIWGLYPVYPCKFTHDLVLISGFILLTLGKFFDESYPEDP